MDTAAEKSAPAAVNAGIYVYITAFFAAIGGLLFGYDIGVVSGVLQMPYFNHRFGDIPNENRFEFPEYSLSPGRKGHIVSTLLAGCFFGAITAGWLADKWGRRLSLRFGSAVFCVGGALEASASVLGQLLFGRFVAGTAVGALSMLVPMYISEVAPREIRGRLISMQQWAITIGIAAAFWLDFGFSFVDSDASWRTPIALQCFPGLLLFTGTLFLPDSPRWLAAKGRRHEALGCLAKLRAGGDRTAECVLVEYAEIESAIETEKRAEGKIGWRDLLFGQKRELFETETPRRFRNGDGSLRRTAGGGEIASQDTRAIVMQENSAVVMFRPQGGASVVVVETQPHTPVGEQVSGSGVGVAGVCLPESDHTGELETPGVLTDSASLHNNVGSSPARHVDENAKDAHVTELDVAAGKMTHTPVNLHLPFRLFLGTMIGIFQQATGINAVMYYAPSIFAQSGLTGTSSQLLATGINGLVNFFMTVPAIMYVDKLGRRNILIAGAALMACALFSLGITLGFPSFVNPSPGIFAQNKSRLPATNSWLSIIFIYIFVAGFAVSWGPIGWIYPAEIFPLAVRSRAISVTTAANWLTNFLIGLLVPYMLAEITWLTYVVFALCCLTMAVFVFFLCPETRGVSLEEMDRLFDKKSKNATHARAVVA